MLHLCSLGSQEFDVEHVIVNLKESLLNGTDESEEGCLLLGDYYVMQEEIESAAYWLSLGASRGCSRSCLTLGSIYSIEWCDATEAIRYFRLAHQRGLRIAYNALLWILEESEYSNWSDSAELRLVACDVRGITRRFDSSKTSREKMREILVFGRAFSKSEGLKSLFDSELVLRACAIYEQSFCQTRNAIMVWLSMWRFGKIQLSCTEKIVNFRFCLSYDVAFLIAKYVWESRNDPWIWHITVY